MTHCQGHTSSRLHYTSTSQKERKRRRHGEKKGALGRQNVRTQRRRVGKEKKYKKEVKKASSAEGALTSEYTYQKLRRSACFC